MTIQESSNGWIGRTTEAESEIVGMRCRVKMITFIKRDGTRFSASYSYLHEIQMIASGLRLEFVRGCVVVQGERLFSIYHALADHRVSFLRESATEFSRDPTSEKAHIRKIFLINMPSMV